MLNYKVTLFLKQKRFVFGILRAKYWSETDLSNIFERGGIRNINIYEAELHCRKSVISGSQNHTADSIIFGNQDKLRKKFNEIKYAGISGGKQAESQHTSDVSAVAEVQSHNSELQKMLVQYNEQYEKYFVNPKVTNFTTDFPKPLRTNIIEGGITERYDLNFVATKLYNFKLTKVQDDGKESSGTIEGTFIGYVIDEIPYEKVIEIEWPPVIDPPPPVGGKKYPFLTGKFEQKTVGREIFRRYEICEAPKEYSWTDWVKVGETVEGGVNTSIWEILFWILLLIIFLFLLVNAWPILLIMAAIVGIAWLSTFNWTSKIFGWIGRFVLGSLSFLSAILVIGGIIALIMNSNQFGKKHPVVTNNTNEQKTEETVSANDTIISHYREWSDYHGNKYSGYLKINKREYRQSSYFRKGYPTVTSDFSYTRMCSSVYSNDTSRLKLVYVFFDSLKTANNLNKVQFAEAIITCVQDIPYYLITPGPCDYSAYPRTDFAHNYLLGGGLCEGFENNGILSPVEFATTLKGDCDTRTIFTYTLLKHFGYNTSVFSSDFYGHSILGVELDVKATKPATTYTYRNVTYSLCELTTYGPHIGQLTEEFSDLSKWKLELN